MRKDRMFNESARWNNYTYNQYYQMLLELSISMFRWPGIPETVDTRFLELTLNSEGQSVFFMDEVLGYLALQCTTGGKFDVYRVPKKRRAYASNGYNIPLTEKNSIIIYNNFLRTSSMLAIESYARRLYNLDRAIDVNANAQKTPVLLQCSEQQKLTLKNAYMQYEGNMPFIFGDKNFNPSSVSVLQTGAPYVSDKLYSLKMQLWNEAYTYIGLPNLAINKKERLLSDEVESSLAASAAVRNSKLAARQQACEKINKMFGLNVWCEFAFNIDNAETEVPINV